MATKLVLHTDRISEEQLAQVDQLLNKIVPADIPIEKYNHLIELPWQGIYPDMESNSAWLQKLSLLIKETTENIEFNLRLLIDENKLVLQVGLETTQEQIDAINALFDRVLPHNLLTEMEWIDGLPMTYTRAYYLESTGYQRINTGRRWNARDEISILYEPTENPNYNIFGSGPSYRLAAAREGAYFELSGGRHIFGAVKGTIKTSAYYSFNELRVNKYSKAIEIADFESTNNIIVCGNADGQYPPKMRLYSYEHKKANGDNMSLIPALSPTGLPGMFDTISGEFKISSGSKQFAIGLTLQQVKDMQFPAPGDVNTLVLSISYDVYNDTEAWNVIENARSLGWEFTFLWNNITEHLTPRIDAIVGAGNYTINYAYADGKLSLAFAEEVVTNVQIAEVESLLNSILPSDIVVEIDEMPVDFTRLEYIENASKAFINLDKSLGWDYEIEAEYFVTRVPESGFGVLIGHAEIPRQCVFTNRNSNGVRYDYNEEVKSANTVVAECHFHVNVDKNVAVFNNLTTNKTYTVTCLAGEFEQPAKVYVFAATAVGSFPAWIKLYSLKGSRDGVPQFDFIPAFDVGSQGPCLFDKVSRKVYRSANPSVDFTYPGAPTQATTYSLRRPTMYAQYTERGIRRLYGVPEPEGYDDTMEEVVLEGYDGTMEGVTEDYNSTITLEEYAAANGFKELVVPPMPETGYWIPEWHETDTQLICEWVETELPAEVYSLEEEFSVKEI